MFFSPKLFESTADVMAETPMLYARMDAAYAQVAGMYGFHCAGCADNCCLTLFFHHTLVEYLFLMKGFYDLSPANQGQIIERAVRVNARVDAAAAVGETSRVICPLNMDGLCVIYDYRPMICRLHGIAHEFRHPSGKMISGTGCVAFESLRAASGPVLDRTPFYKDMAALEGRVREKTGIRERFKMTVAQMLVAAGESLP